MMRSLALLVITTLALSACGRVGPLERTKGMRPLPVAVGNSKPATGEQLIQPNTQSRPGRNIDILVHSDKRVADPFDLPPGPKNGRQD